MNYGKALTKASAHKGLIKKQMAASVGVSTNYFYDICASKRKPSIDLLENIAVSCDVKLSTLIKWGEE